MVDYLQNAIVSVIVPVYKAEPYLCKCLDSITGQTYQNLEIILVNNDSPDNCGAICDKYATHDRRIRVIHQKNGGPSAARNTGLEIASGAYIGFVDSDDWIEPNMYECLLSNLLQVDADIVVCGRLEEYQNRSVLRGWEQEKLLNTEDALELLLRDEEIKNYVWDKLYRRELFYGIRFPEGSVYEDLAIQHQLFIQAGKVLCLPEAFYHYRQRADSLVNDISMRSRIQYFEAAKKRYDELKDLYPQYEPLMAAQCVVGGISTWSTYYRHPVEEREKYCPQIQRISAFAKEHYRAALEEAHLGIAGRIIVRLIPYMTWWSFAGAGLCGILYKLKSGRMM